jgi:hypothetical protein
MTQTGCWITARRAVVAEGFESKSLLNTEAGSLRSKSKEGKVGWALLWLMGAPIPFLALLFLLRGCD